MNVPLTLKGSLHSLSLKNPILTASGTFGYGLEFAPFGNLASLGGFIVKGLSLTPRKGNPPPRICETTSGMLNAVGLQNDGLEYFLSETLPKLPTSETAVIANIYAGSLEEFEELGERLNEHEEIAALEVNISCPNVKQGGVLFGQDPLLAGKVVRCVRKGAPKKFLIIKLSPNVTSIADIAKSAEANGADAISCINTLLGMAVDLRSRKPKLANIVGGLSGPCIKPVALRCVWQVAKAVSLPVIGCGGIQSAEDVLEFLLVGARAVEIGTANFLNPKASFDLVQDLPRLMEELGITNLDEFCGSLQV